MELSAFLKRYRDDDSEWWRLDAGDMQNLFDDAVDLMLGFEKTANEQIARAEAAEAEAARLREVLTALAGDEPPADSDEVLRAGR